MPRGWWIRVSSRAPVVWARVEMAKDANFCLRMGADDGYVHGWAASSALGVGLYRAGWRDDAIVERTGLDERGWAGLWRSGASLEPSRGLTLERIMFLTGE